MVKNDKELTFHCNIDKIQKYKNCFIFTIVRNPYMRIFSCYRDKFFSKDKLNNVIKIEKEIKDPTFLDFLKYIDNQDPEKRDPHWQPQSVLHLSNIIDCDYVGYIEDFDNSMNHIINTIYKNKINFHDIKDNIPKNSRQARFDHKGYFTDEVIELIQKIYKKDFKMFGYSTDITKKFEKPC
jgi:hypothetical protein